MGEVKMPFYRDSVIYKASRILPKRDKNKFFAVVLLQIIFGLLDLVGVGVIGVLGALAVNGLSSKEPGERVSFVLEVLNIQDFSLQSQALTLGLLAALLLVGKTIFSVIFTRKILFFLSRKAAQLSGDLIARLFSHSLLTIQSRSMQEIMFSVTNGVSILTVGVLGTSITLISDISLLMVMFGGLLFVDPKIAISSFLAFVPIGFILFQLMKNRARTLGDLQSTVGVESSERILEVIGSYREILVKNRRDYYSRIIAKQRLDFANISAELSFFPSISKYVLEITVVFGLLIVSIFQFVSNDATRAFAGLTVFLAASTRITPAILRIQQGSVSLKASIGGATKTLQLIELLKNSERIEKVDDNVITEHGSFESSIEISNLTFQYPGNENKTINGANLTIKPGQVVAIVGSSGAGKTTLIDLILGVLKAESGNVQISGVEPLVAISKWPGAISYVPQDVMISNGSVLTNVVLGYPASGEESESLAWEALEKAHLKEYVENLPDGLNTYIGDRGSRLSGGQRQRLGIARAMFTKPKLLVLDEATSNLDGMTEAAISDSINELRGSVTVLMIAHRLSTVKKADLVVYMENGKIISSGTFDQVRVDVPNFDQQAKLMGL